MAQVKEVDFKDLYLNGVLVSLQVRMWGATTKYDKERLLIKDEDKEVVRAVQDLIADKSKLELLRTIKNESLGWIKRNSLPSPVREMEFLPKHKIEAADEFLQGQQKRFIEAAEDLVKVYDDLKKDFAEKHPEIYKPEKYPSKEQLRDRFEFRYTFRMFNVPDATLSAVSPEIYNKEVKKFKDEMEEMKTLIISEVGKEFLARIDSLKKQCIDGENISSRTITAINGLLEKFDDLWDGFVFDKALRETVADIREYMEGTDAEMLKVDNDFRKMVGNKMTEVASELEKIKEVKPKRALAI